MRCLICLQDIVVTVTWVTFLRGADEQRICSKCSEQLVRINGGGCPVCSRNDSQGVCPDCDRWEQTHQGLLENNTSVFHYNEFAKELVARWKYRGDYILIESLKNEITNVFNRLGLKEFPLVSIPLSQERLEERGFNQSEAIIRHLGYRSLSLLERKGIEKQSKKNRKERLLSENPFLLKQSVKEPVVLVDDIYTTGTTLRHVASLLKEQGCPNVYAFTIFR